MKQLLATLALGGWFLLAACGESKAPVAPPPPPPTLPVVEIQTQTVPLYQDFVGQIYGAEDIAIRARVEGFLEGIHFDEGTQVEKGDLLYTIESQSFEADVAARLSQVAEAKTVLAKTASDLKRIRPLAERRAVSQTDLDAAVAHYEAAEASLEAAQANLRAAKIRLSYTKVLSPITGIIGKTWAKVGDLVGRGPDTAVLNEVSRIDTVNVEFFLTETQYLQLARRYAAASGRDEDVQGRRLQLILADGSVYDHKGRFNFIDRQVDPTTGAIRIQASFDNPERLLRPGQFAKVRAEVETVQDAILVPQRCVTERQGRHSVFVVGEGNKVSVRQVRVGPTVNGSWLIREGLKAGEKIVYEGLQRVKEGTVIQPEIRKAQPPDRKEN